MVSPWKCYALVYECVEPIGLFGYVYSASFYDGEDSIDTGDLIVDDLERNYCHSAFAFEFLDKRLTRGFVFYVHGTETFAAPAIVELDKALFEFGEVVLASHDIDEINVAVLVHASSDGYGVVGRLGFLETCVDCDDAGHDGVAAYIG